MLKCLVPIILGAVIVSMIAPLPPWLLDVMLVANIAITAAILVGAIQAHEVHSLTALPSMILIGTLFRLALTIASTRMILSTGEAGRVIESLGAIMLRGNLGVGVVLFILISIIEFIVIAKGSERIAEVAARFTLDALPGKQMSIDADLRAGVIDFQIARRLRDDLQTESRLYGALDGSMKFIKGDVIAGMIIAVVNLSAGVAIGLVSDGLPLLSALHTYATLTIGEGLVSQIPALLNSLTAGLVVTRVARAEASTLTDDVARQLTPSTGAKLALSIAGIGALCLPGFPILPFFTLALIGTFLSVIGKLRRERSVPCSLSPLFTPRAPHLIEIEGCGAPEKRERMEKICVLLREQLGAQLFSQWGIILPPLHCSTSFGEDHEWRVSIRGIVIARVSDSADSTSEGEIVQQCATVIEKHLPELMDDSRTRALLCLFEGTHAELIENLIPQPLSVTQLTALLRGLVHSGVSIQQLDLILQTVAEHAELIGKPQRLTQLIRVALRRTISRQLASPSGKLRGWILDPEFDQHVIKALALGEQFSARAMLELGSRVRDSAEEGGIIVCSSESRSILADSLRMQQARVRVLAYDELDDSVEFECLGTIACSSKPQTSILETA